MKRILTQPTKTTIAAASPSANPSPTVYNPAYDTKSVTYKMNALIGKLNRELDGPAYYHKSATYEECVNLAHRLDKAYWVDNNPLVSDEDYDRLLFYIKYAESKTGYTAPDSPTNYVGLTPANGRRQVLRRSVMLSTEKAQTIEKVQKWMSNTSDKLYGPTADIFTLEWKFDGVSLSLVYVNGKLTEASEGKGLQGNDVLKHCQYIQSIPKEIPALASEPRIEVRGEVVMPFDLLEKTIYKNCRSASAGIMANNVPVADECALLNFYPWWVDGLDLSERRKNAPFVSLDSQAAMMFELDKLNFNYAHVNTIAQVSSTQQLVSELKNAEEVRSCLSFPTDGVVVKVISKSLWADLGATDHHPKCMIAYKFAAKTAVSTVRRIEITIGEKTGKRTPVVYFDPVVINGATYQKASVGSEAKLTELDIYVGSRVEIALRNDVIPHINRVIV